MMVAPKAHQDPIGIIQTQTRVASSANLEVLAVRLQAT
jgi:hypothetical protein